ncbi:UNVERIFIED_CONTAM: inhibitor of Brome mosaic virus [Siphonaria sp. JEL0065]|nr:inhibitor of Brome mosaic virus [Siphonaria sp. JEL0065]
MAIKRKPGGLKKAAAAAATEKVVEKKEEEAPAIQTSKDEITVALDDVEAGDEVGEVAAMFELALGKLEVEGDIEEGACLLRGVVHESDRILRVRFEEGLTEPLDARFHLTYGAALFRLGLLLDADAQDNDNDQEEEGDNAAAYVDAAIDRFETGLELWPESWQLHEAIGRAQIEKANLIVRSDPTVPTKTIDASVIAAHKHLASALAALADKDLDESVAIITILIRHSQLREDQEGAKKWTNVARVELNKLLKSNATHIGALVALGATYMSAANDLLDAGENGDNVDMEAVGKLIDEALKYSTKANVEAEKKGQPNVKLQLLLGEAYVNKANLLDEAENEDDANEFYKKAVACFKIVQEIDASALPEAFDSFLQEWESEMQ